MSKSHSRDGGTSPHNQGSGDSSQTSATATSGRSTPPKEELSVATPTEEKRAAAKAVGLVSPVEHSADSDDHLEDLNDSESVNLVALNEVSKPNGMVFSLTGLTKFFSGLRGKHQASET